MKKEKSTELSDLIVNNLRKIMNDRNLTQAAIGRYMDYDSPTTSKIFNGAQSLTLDNVSKLAKGLSLREIDLITYPDVYVPKEKRQDETVEAVLQIKLTKEKKDQVLKLVFGENNIEILNR